MRWLVDIAEHVRNVSEGNFNDLRGRDITDDHLVETLDWRLPVLMTRAQELKWHEHLYLSSGQRRVPTIGETFHGLRVVVWERDYRGS